MRDELQFVLKVAQDLPPAELPNFLGELEVIHCTALARLTSPEAAQPVEDRLLAVEEASRRLGVSKDYLYRHGNDFPFMRRMGRKLLFSSAGIEKHIRQQDGVAARRRSR
jgi:excisionase family DNA binding protein